uniref:Kinesin light chain n=1 Tax=Guillardia theta TaxID=55529 RepID=A0A7S4PHC2_GUITH
MYGAAAAADAENGGGSGVAHAPANRPYISPDEAADLKRRIRQHDQMYAAMQQQSKPFDALEHLEKGLFVRKELFGPDHPEVSKVCQIFTTSCNTLAMNSLQRDNHLLAYELLKKAEILTSPSGYIRDKKMRMKLRAVTFNNFGCFYKRRGKLHAALQYLAKALKIELTSEEVDNPAGTHLNLCATLSQLGRHGPALEHAQCALELLEAMAASRKQKVREDENGGGKNATDDASILAIAWHNLAVEQEHLNMVDEALASYEQAVKVAEKEWGEGHIKTLAIKHSLEEARSKTKNRRSHSQRPAVSQSHGQSPLQSVLNPHSSSSQLKFAKKSTLRSTSPTKARYCC